MIKLIICTVLFICFSACGAKESAKDIKVKDLEDVCECVNMEEPSDACKEIEKEWKDKYKEASDEEKEKMRKEFEECAK